MSPIQLALERVAADVLQRGRAGQVVTRRRLRHRRQGVGQAAVERRRHALRIDLEHLWCHRHPRNDALQAKS